MWQPPAALPTGTVAFLLSDVQGSTRLPEHFPDGMRRATTTHDINFQRFTHLHGGVEVRPRGEGDSRFCVFPEPHGAVAAAVEIQRALHAETWPMDTPLKVRIGIHTGEADLRAGDYYGSAVNRCARLRPAGHGGQTLVYGATAAAVASLLPAGVRLRDLGERRLKDLLVPERIFQLVIDGLPSDCAPIDVLDNPPTTCLSRPRDVDHRPALPNVVEPRLRHAGAR